MQLALLVCVAVVGSFLIPRHPDSFGTRGQALIAGGGVLLPLGLAGIAALAGLMATIRLRSARALLAVSLIGSGASMLPVHWLAGQLLFPHELAEALRESSDVAIFCSSRHGLYPLLSSDKDVEKLQDESMLGPWRAQHPGGLLVVGAEYSLETGVVDFFDDV